MTTNKLSHPYAKATALVGVVASILHLGVLKAAAGAFWASLGTIFPALSISAFSLAGEVAWLPQRTLKTMAIAVGVAYVAKLGYKSYLKFQSRL